MRPVTPALMPWARPAWVAVLGVLSGCGDVLSSEVTTAKMRADVELRAWEEGSAAMGVSLKSRRPLRKWVELEDGDALYATFDGETVAMFEEQVAKKHTYVAWFDDIEPGDQVSVSLEREGDADAPLSWAALPPPFEVTLGSSEVEMGWEGLDLFWTPASPDDEMLIDVDASCIDDFSLRVADSGTAHISASRFTPLDQDNPTNCTAVIEFRRERPGELDPALRGGSAIGVQIRVTDVYVSSFFYF